MMERRRLLQLIGGSSVIGEFSKYQKLYQAGETQENRILISHSLGVIPKLVIISCSITDVPYTTEGYIREAVFIPAVGAGDLVSSVNHTEAAGGFLPAETLTNGKFNMSSTEVNIYQQSTVGKWSKDTLYTVELYA